MNQTRVGRRTILGGLSSAVAAGLITRNASAQAAKQVPWSKGTERATVKMPANATDCHHHIYDSRWPIDGSSSLRPGDATVADYRLLQARLGTTRNVIIQPSTYGVDNSGMLEAMKEFGLKTTRAVAVVNTKVTDAELHRLHEAGVRGIRFNLVNAGAATSPEMIDPLSKRIAPLGWHVQVHMLADQIVSLKNVWSALPCPVVFDHLGHLPEPQGTSHPAFGLITDLMKSGKGWVKLTGLYMETKVGPPTYSDGVKVARAYAETAPNQVVWGTDWPHPTEKPDNKPDDAILTDLLPLFIPDEAKRTQALVHNPDRLYQF